MKTATKQLVKKLNENGIKCDCADAVGGGDLLSVWVAGPEKDVKFELLAVIDASQSSLIVRCFNIWPVTPAGKAAVYPVLNELNMDMQWVKFYIDEENKVAAGADAVITAGTAADISFEILLRTSNAVCSAWMRLKKEADA